VARVDACGDLLRADGVADRFGGIDRPQTIWSAVKDAGSRLEA
jgi:hypothetical protein